MLRPDSARTDSTGIQPQQESCPGFHHPKNWNVNRNVQPSIPPRCPASTMQLSSLSLSSSMMTMTMTGSRCPRCQRPPPPSSTSSSLSSISSTDATRGEEDGQRGCPAAVGGHTTRIAGWAAATAPCRQDGNNGR